MDNKLFWEAYGFIPGLKSWAFSCVSRKYLEFTKTETPKEEDLARFRDVLKEKRLSISTINNYCFAIKRYHEMIGQTVEFPFVKPKNTIPFFFDESDITKIFSVCSNLKHFAMLQTLFYACLRASELCSLDDSDIDLKTLSVRIRDGKGGKEGISCITNECAQTLKQYLKVRPPLEIDGRKPLFYTDYGKCWIWTLQLSLFRRTSGQHPKAMTCSDIILFNNS